MPNNDYLDFLAHYGIVGQKWGVRRYQNPDGSLTNAGQKRYKTDARRYEDKLNESLETEGVLRYHLQNNRDRLDKKTIKEYEKGVRFNQKLANKTAKKLYNANSKRVNDAIKRQTWDNLFSLKSKADKESMRRLIIKTINDADKIRVSTKKIKSTDAYENGFYAFQSLVYALEKKAGMKTEFRS